MNRSNIQIHETAYPSMSHDAALSADASKQLQIHSIAANNGYAGAVGLGLFSSINEAQWKMWGVTASDTELTDTIQADSAITLIPTTNNYGFIAQAKDRFNALTFNIAQAETGSPVYSYQYYNGSAWTTLTLLNAPVYTGTGKMAIVFSAPLDWAVGDSTNTTDDTMYSIRVRATTAPSQSVTIDSLKLCKIIAYRKNVAENGVLVMDMGACPLLLQGSESIIPYFSTASAANRLEIAYKLNP